MDLQTLLKSGACLTLAVVLVSSCGDVVNEVEFSRKVRSLQVGMTEDEVLRRLGPPGDSGSEFYLGQAAGYENEYRAAAASPSVRYLFWRIGVANDVICAVGFDRNHRVSYGACGGT